MCDASQPAAVATLRERKRRPHKPLAVLFPQRGVDGLDAVREHALLDPASGEALLSAARPIVLVTRGLQSTIATEVAPNLSEIGALLPYSPLHHLLMSSFGSPLVATSGNVSGEPVLCDNDEARMRLSEVADAFLHHDRRIARPADDSIVRVVRSRARVLRLGRGLAPCEMTLPSPVRVPLLAVGGHLKTSHRARVGKSRRSLAAHRRYGYGAKRACVCPDRRGPAAAARCAGRRSCLRRTSGICDDALGSRVPFAGDDGAAPSRARLGARHRKWHQTTSARIRLGRRGFR